jgi:excisionase family DNA binding protein
MDATPKHLTETEVEELYGIPRRTLQTWRLQRRVLPFLKLGKLVRYRAADLEAYARKNLVAVDAK